MYIILFILIIDIIFYNLVPNYRLSYIPIIWLLSIDTITWDEENYIKTLEIEYPVLGTLVIENDVLSGTYNVYFGGKDKYSDYYFSMYKVDRKKVNEIIRGKEKYIINLFKK